MKIWKCITKNEHRFIVIFKSTTSCKKSSIYLTCVHSTTLSFAFAATQIFLFSKCSCSHSCSSGICDLLEDLCQTCRASHEQSLTWLSTAFFSRLTCLWKQTVQFPISSQPRWAQIAELLGRPTSSCKDLSLMKTSINSNVFSGTETRDSLHIPDKTISWMLKWISGTLRVCWIVGRTQRHKVKRGNWHRYAAASLPLCQKLSFWHFQNICQTQIAELKKIFWQPNPPLLYFYIHHFTHF